MTEPDTTAAVTTTTSPATTLATTSPASAPPTAAATTAPPDNRRVGLWQAGVARANELSEALVAGDWDSVRRINPTTIYTDQQLTDGYAGLVNQEILLAGRRAVDSDTVVLYFMLLADEERPAPQTSVYCVRWDYHGDTNTIVQQLGAFVDRTEGFSRDAEGAAWMCADLESGSMLDSPSRAEGSQLIGAEIDEGVVQFAGSAYECAPPPRMLGVARECRRPGSPPDSQPAVLCSTADDSGVYWDCNGEGYYPFELDGLDVVTINGERGVCAQETGDCWIWPPGVLPSEAVFFDPDYRCINELCEPEQ